MARGSFSHGPASRRRAIALGPARTFALILAAVVLVAPSGASRADGGAGPPEPIVLDPGNPPGTDPRDPVAAAPGSAPHPSTAENAPLASCAKALAARVQAYYDSVSDFRARFRQRTRSVTLGNASLGSDAPSIGLVELAKPGKMRWVYESPEPSLLISDGQTMWLYDPAAGEVQRLPVMEGVLTGAALEFLIGEGRLLESFDVGVAACEPDADGRVEMELKPRQDASYERLGMTVDSKTGEIHETKIVDLFGNETRIVFSEMQVNLEPPPGRFQFQPPSGVQVIDLVPEP